MTHDELLTLARTAYDALRAYETALPAYDMATESLPADQGVAAAHAATSGLAWFLENQGRPVAE